MEKSYYRKVFIDKLSSLTTSQKYINNKRVIAKLDELLKTLKPNSIMSYISLDKEVKIEQYLNKKRHRYNIFVPFMEGVSFKLVKYRLPLHVKKYSIKEPKNSIFRKVDIDVAIVPVLGVDGSFRRVGFGKGMYDRFFEKFLKKDIKPLIVFIELVDCFVEDDFCQEHDIEADLYITPKKIYKKRANINGNTIKYSSCRGNSRRFGRFFNIKKYS